ncbi:IS66 family transposase [Aggregicoccus sp. 17bor-14]|nr:IS66 family transposase [Simulacricoccus sp. 17bor-14]MRI92120.1 IS66 family transposase [Aggregicoccus sp. 17bor-14]
MAALPEDHTCPWREEAEKLKDELGELRAQLEQLRRHVFGRKSEKMPPISEELRKERPAPSPEAVKKTRAVAREALAQSAITEVVHHRVPEEERRCPACGGRDLKPLGEGKKTVVYEYVPARLVKQVHVQETLACRCGAGVVTAAGAPKAVEGGHYGPGLIAHVVTAKVADSIPVYRQAKALRRAGIPLHRNTLGDLLHTAARQLAPLSARLLKLIAREDVVRADETYGRVLAEGKTRRGFLWTFRTRWLVGFRFSPTRSGETPREVLGETKGYLVVDGFTGYNAVTLPEGRVRVACWAHARRKFFDARTTAPAEVDAMLALIRALYRVEQEAKEAGVSGTPVHLQMRLHQSAAVLRDIDAWLAREAPLHPPKSPLGEAIRYTRGQWRALCRFLERADLPLDNNESERALRPAALGRKNYLFFGNDEAGEHLADLYALVATCEANGVDPQRYLTDVLVRIGTTRASRIDSLLPHRWSPNTS